MTITPLEHVLVTSRDFDEYLLMFGLDERAVLDVRVLDCPGGASDFATTVRERGGDVVSVDPLYGGTPHKVAATVSADLDSGLARAAEVAQMYDFSWAGGVEWYVERRRRAARRFLTDFTEDHERGGRKYVNAALPSLPFDDAAFDLTLVPNLLFTYANLFDLGWHLDAIRELMRVSAEVRIHPVADSAGQPYPQLKQLRAALTATGIETEVRGSAYRLHRHADSTLICRATPPTS